MQKFIDNDKIIEVFNYRHACKKFDENKSLSQEDLNTILEAARLSPSSFGFEPWKFLVLDNKSQKNKDLRQKLYPICWGGQKSLEAASHYIIILARKKLDMSPNSQYLNYMMNEVMKLDEETKKLKMSFYSNFMQNEFKLLDDDKAIFDWSCKQTYIALANMMSVGAFLGVDSCAIEGFNPQKLDELLEKEGILDKNHFGVSVMVGFGYKKENAKRPKTRQEFKKVVEFL